MDPETSYGGGKTTYRSPRLVATFYDYLYRAGRHGPLPPESTTLINYQKAKIVLTFFDIDAVSAAGTEVDGGGGEAGDAAGGGDGGRRGWRAVL